MMVIHPVSCGWIVFGCVLDCQDRYAIFFEDPCGLLEIIPLWEIARGARFTCIMAGYSQGGWLPLWWWGCCSAMALIQFLQFYILSPLVMREQVNLSPLFTIVVLIRGRSAVGDPGDDPAIPLFLGILKIRLRFEVDGMEFLKPFWFLLGRDDEIDRGLRFNCLRHDARAKRMISEKDIELEELDQGIAEQHPQAPYATTAPADRRHDAT